MACGATGLITLFNISSRGNASRKAVLKSLAFALFPANGPLYVPPSGPGPTRKSRCSYAAESKLMNLFCLILRRKSTASFVTTPSAMSTSPLAIAACSSVPSGIILY